MKRWKRNAAALLCALFCAQWLCPARGENVPITTAQPLVAALQATGAELDRGYFVGSAYLADCGAQDAARQADAVLAAFGFAGARVVEEQQHGEAGYSYALAVKEPQMSLRVAVRRLSEAQSAQKTLRLQIEVWREGLQTHEVAPIEAKIRAAIEKSDGIPRISTCLEGHLDGKLRKDQRRLALEDAFAAVGANITARTEAEVYDSYVGYTPLLREMVRAGGMRLNLNAAMRYHAYDGSTHVVVGSPVIAVPY